MTIRDRFWALAGALLIVMTGYFLSGTEPVLAQEPILEETLPPAQGVGLEHLNGATSELEGIIKVGNLPIGSHRMCCAPTEVLSDTAYHRGYLRFSLAGIPRSSTVVQAELVLNVARFEYGYVTIPSPGDALNIGVYPVAEAWSPAASWTWDALPRILTETVASTSLVFGQTGDYGVDVTALVQGWVDGASNDGVMVGMYPDPDGVAEFTAVIHGHSAVSPTLAPRLVIRYQEPPTKTIYLPFVVAAAKPDLVITNIRLDPLRVSIENQGRGAAGAFWVDLGVDPQQTPEVNQVWHQWGSDYGAAWEIPALGAGEAMTLTLGDAWYDAAQSRWPAGFSAGDHALWAYVDSWGPPNPWGGVDEKVEDNNLYGPAPFVIDAARAFFARPQDFTPIPPREQATQGGAR